MFKATYVCFAGSCKLTKSMLAPLKEVSLIALVFGEYISLSMIL